MISKLNLQLKEKPIANRLLFSLSIIFIFILGRNIPLPLVSFEGNTAYNNFLEAVTSITGGSWTQSSLFSLGLSPWMSSQIIWQFISRTEWYERKKVSQERSDIFLKTLTLLIALIQAIALVSIMDLSLPKDASRLIEMQFRLSVIIMMMAGSFLLIWLANQNTENGLGGPAVIVVTSILLELPGQIIRYVATSNSNRSLIVLAFMFLYVFVLLVFAVLFHNSERRIPINQVLINNQLQDKTYIPIRVNPAAGQPLMYAMSLMALPIYLIEAIMALFGENDFLLNLIKELSLSRPLGIINYLILIFLLTIGFSFVNYPPDDIAKGLKESGNYIHGLRPGIQTEIYIKRIVLIFALFSASYTCIVTGLPLIISLFTPLDQSMAFFPVRIIILVPLILNVIEEIDALGYQTQYDLIFDQYWNED